MLQFFFPKYCFFSRDSHPGPPDIIALTLRRLNHIATETVDKEFNSTKKIAKRPKVPFLC